jgi:hypothetical protein
MAVSIDKSFPRMTETPLLEHYLLVNGLKYFDDLTQPSSLQTVFFFVLFFKISILSCNNISIQI